jgi:hypothetical protein
VFLYVVAVDQNISQGSCAEYVPKRSKYVVDEFLE